MRYLFLALTLCLVGCRNEQTSQNVDNHIFCESTTHQAYFAKSTGGVVDTQLVRTPSADNLCTDTKNVPSN